MSQIGLSLAEGLLLSDRCKMVFTGGLCGELLYKKYVLYVWQCCKGAGWDCYQARTTVQ